MVKPASTEKTMISRQKPGSSLFWKLSKKRRFHSLKSTLTPTLVKVSAIAPTSSGMAIQRPRT